MAKPTTESLPSHVQDAVGMLDNVIAGHVANNPKMAQEEKLASPVEGSGAFKGAGVSVASETASNSVPNLGGGQGKGIV
jgi:hypothetical protein